LYSAYSIIDWLITGCKENLVEDCVDKNEEENLYSSLVDGAPFLKRCELG
jgi:hypothetical protein